jgi:hypothetical protein
LDFSGYDIDGHQRAAFGIEQNNVVNNEGGSRTIVAGMQMPA